VRGDGKGADATVEKRRRGDGKDVHVTLSFLRRRNVLAENDTSKKRARERLSYKPGRGSECEGTGEGRGWGEAWEETEDPRWKPIYFQNGSNQLAALLAGEKVQKSLWT
jgi:hypothetical protein